jgi:3-methyladenine DNA glycosylase/8-oxoguanine DNA glycosylase
MRTRLEIPTTDDFSFRSTVYSHGWCELAPFDLDTSLWTLQLVLRNGDKVFHGRLREEGPAVLAEFVGELPDESRAVRDIKHILRLDEDLRTFYDIVGVNDRLAWIHDRKAGRLLRSPTVYEDLIKTLCTTNCSWGLTKVMVNNLVNKLGDRTADGVGAFPTPQQMAEVSADYYRAEIKCGYRAPYLAEVAAAVARGELDVEAWLTSELPTPELKKGIKKVKGVGDYAAENLLKLLGRYDGLALDSWLRSQFYKNHNDAKACPDKQIEQHYSKYGKWSGLVIWCDMTEKWITD